MSARSTIVRPAVAVGGTTRATAQRIVRAADAWSTWLALLGSFLVVAALYGRALGFAFFFDDTFDLTRVEGRSYWQLLSSSKGYSYYRPLPFLMWKALRQLQGRYDQATLHTLPLIAHALAGWLLYLLVKRLGAGQWAVFPALLFLTYPFAYQAVPIVGTLFHPLAGAAILAALALYQRARVTPGRQARGWHVAALVATGVALWTHESGVVVAPLIVGLEAVVLWRSRSRRPSPWMIGHLIAAGLFVLAWFNVDKAPFVNQTSLAELHPKALFFLQGFTYPLSAQMFWIEDHTPKAPGIVDLGMLALAGGFGAYALSAWRTRHWGRLLIPALGVSIALAAAAPSVARLSWAYIENSPRLLYLVGIGAALFWGLLPMLSFRQRWLTLTWRVATIVALCGIVVQSWRFVDVRMLMFERGTRIVNATVAEGETYQGQRLLVVNAPSWFAQGSYEYLYGHYGVQIMPSYIGLDRVIYTSSERSASVDARSAALNPDVSGAPYTFGPHGADATPEQIDAFLREGRELINVRRAGTGFSVRDVGRLQSGQAERLADAPGRLGDGVWVSTTRGVVSRQGLVVYLTWNVLAPVGADVETLIELRDTAGNRLDGYQGDALAGNSAPRLWQTGDRVEDSILLTTPPPGAYTIWAGLQRVGSDERLPATMTSGEATSDGLIQVGQIVVP